MGQPCLAKPFKSDVDAMPMLHLSKHMHTTVKQRIHIGSGCELRQSKSFSCCHYCCHYSSRYYYYHHYCYDHHYYYYATVTASRRILVDAYQANRIASYVQLSLLANAS